MSPPWRTLTFFGHEADEAAPDLHVGGLDLTLAGWCPSADTQEVMSHTLGARPEHVPPNITCPLQPGRKGKGWCAFRPGHVCVVTTVPTYGAVTLLVHASQTPRVQPQDRTPL